MTELEKQILDKFKALLAQRVRLHQMILFGSRARGDADDDSDMDVLVILESEPDHEVRSFIRDCAWEAGFDHFVHISPVICSRENWFNSPIRSSLLATAVNREGIPV